MPDHWAAHLEMEARRGPPGRRRGSDLVADEVAEAHESCEGAAPPGRTAHVFGVAVLVRPLHGVRLLLAELGATHAVTFLYSVARNDHFSGAAPPSRLRGHA